MKKRGRPVNPIEGARVRINGTYVSQKTAMRLKASGLSLGQTIDKWGESHVLLPASRSQPGGSHEDFSIDVR